MHTKVAAQTTPKTEDVKVQIGEWIQTFDIEFKRT